MTPGRRPLAFTELEEILADVERLLDGHRTVGRWSLAQILSHLAMAFRFSVDGFESPPAPWLARVTIGKIARWSMFSRSFIPEGAPLPRHLRPPEQTDARAEAAELRQRLAAFVAAPSPLAIHPLLGAMTKDEYIRYHCVHCAHHLSFAVPSTHDGSPCPPPPNTATID